MNRMIMAAALAAVAAMPQGASAALPAAAANDALAALDLGALGVLQQGTGGGKPEDRGGSAPGGGQRETRATGNGRGGRDEPRATERRQQPDRAESGRGRSSSSSSSSETRRGNESPGGRSSAAREERGSGSSSSSSANARSERGSSGSGASASSRGERGSGSSAASGNERGSSNANAGTARGSGARRDRLDGSRLQSRIAALPQGLRQMATSSRPSDRFAVGAIARGHARGLNADAFDVRRDGSRLRVLNRSGQLLLDLDDDRARDLGAWRLRRLGDRQPTGNAPAFCRSGAGHPVFGRQWCLDKGFGLGSRAGTLWSRGGIDDVVWRRRTDDRLDRGGLAGVLGDVILGRLALQAIALGYDQPLVGFWVAQPEGPRILRVHSGDYEVAELVDTDRDDRADVLYVVQPVW